MRRIEEIEKDIQNLNIQGATNVAIATLEGMKILAQESDEKSAVQLLEMFLKTGDRLSHARPNEPLAQNAIKYVKYKVGERKNDLQSLESMKQALLDYTDEYLEIISNSKKDIINNSPQYIKLFENVLTHCHSSTAVSLIKSIAQGKDSFDAVCTETRPLFQGRKTAKSLLEAGISTTMIADSAAESFMIGRGSLTVDALFIGCDSITMRGHCINKIGSWGIAMAAYYAEKPVYVVSPLLKLETEIPAEGMTIEVREDRELWEDAPKDLKIFNPAFEFVDNRMISGFLTEFGVIKPKEVSSVAREKYPWLFEN